MVASVLLFAGVAVELLACAGILLVPGALEKLHFAGAGVPAALLIGAAVLVDDSFSLLGTRAILVGALVLVSSPVLTHTTARLVVRR